MGSQIIVNNEELAANRLKGFSNELRDSMGKTLTEFIETIDPLRWELEDKVFATKSGVMNCARRLHLVTKQIGSIDIYSYKVIPAGTLPNFNPPSHSCSVFLSGNQEWPITGQFASKLFDRVHEARSKSLAAAENKVQTLVASLLKNQSGTLKANWKFWKPPRNMPGNNPEYFITEIGDILVTVSRIFHGQYFLKKVFVHEIVAEMSLPAGKVSIVVSQGNAAKLFQLLKNSFTTRP